MLAFTTASRTLPSRPKTKRGVEYHRGGLPRAFDDRERRDRKGIPMQLQDREVTIQEIIDECGRRQNEASKIVMKWRVKLEKEPSLLEPFQIDQIVREVRKRLGNVPE